MLKNWPKVSIQMYSKTDIKTQRARKKKRPTNTNTQSKETELMEKFKSYIHGQRRQFFNLSTSFHMKPKTERARRRESHKEMKMIQGEQHEMFETNVG